MHITRLKCQSEDEYEISSISTIMDRVEVGRLADLTHPSDECSQGLNMTIN
jgi:hypothetical protein